ncbi:hypothetical protein RclHR1_01220039 [Rhizophagus clarus]|uniref:Uncharacterized protein n=1 Tax=Rhizophagus clarus TaxID=94130 RepID=A0A2Z6Q6K3_9GLOM|nr:hypothetical protein RclHR1_01220039 [Rhizophagus clarus]GES85748.1 hypothetical protein GLOIN_2v1790954 [Rhizophagus clarus]
MSNVHTLNDIEGRGAVGSLLGKQILSGRRLSSICESELEKALRSSIKTASDIANDYKDLQDVCLKQKKDLVLVQANANKKISQLNATNTRLRSSEQLSRSERKAEREKYSAKIKSLKSLIKTLEKEATLAQKASSLDKIKILSLETKISELEGKLENLKLEQVFHDSNINGGILEELGKQEDLKLPDWIDESLKSFVYALGLENKVKEIKKKIAKEDLLEVLQKALSERNSLIQEAKLKELTNVCLAEQIQKTSSEYEVHGRIRSCLSASDQNEPSSISKLEKDNDITSPELIRPQRDLSILPITAGHKVIQALVNKKSDSFFSACNHLRSSITNHILPMVHNLSSIFILQ